MPAFCDGLDSPVGNPNVLPHPTQGSVPPHPTPDDLRVLIPKNVYVLGGREQQSLGPNSGTEWGLSRYFWKERKDESVANQTGGVQLPGEDEDMTPVPLLLAIRLSKQWSPRS